MEAKEIKYPKVKSSVAEPIKMTTSSFKVKEGCWYRPIYDYEDYKKKDMSFEEVKRFIELEMLPQALTFKNDSNDYHNALMWLCGMEKIVSYKTQIQELFKLVE